LSKIDRAKLNLRGNQLDVALREEQRKRNREKDPVAADTIDTVRELFGKCRVVYVGAKRPRL